MSNMDKLKEYMLDYEIRASWWACYVSWGWARNVAASYFAWKVNRKVNRWRARTRI